jgi:malate dehydrogenase (oxaloacetate-decarboxylating)
MAERDKSEYNLPTAGFSVTVRIKLKNVPGSFSRVGVYVADSRASLAEVSLVHSDFSFIVRDITIHCRCEEHATEIVEGITGLEQVELVSWIDDTFEVHKGGKLEISSRVQLKTTDDLSRSYTPGVARVCTSIEKNPSDVYRYTIKSNAVAVVTDGSAVLGLGNIGPAAAMPVMEGKAVLFKHFANVDAYPICLDTQDPDEIISIVKAIAPGFGGINLEDIAAPGCFEVERRLDEELNIPVFHDDQHGTAAVVLAGLLNSLKIVGKKLEDLKVVVNGFGAGGVACTRMILAAGVKNIIPCDRAGVVYRGRKERMNPVKEEVIQVTNPDNVQGTLSDALKGADVFIGVSEPGAMNRDDVKGMARDPIIFALANPVPEIMPDEVRDVARVIATGRSDYENQINNVLCFPGLFRGALDARAKKVTDGMKLAAAQAIADSIDKSDLNEKFIIPSVFAPEVSERVAKAVYKAAMADGVSQVS